MEQVAKVLDENRNFLLRTLDVAAVAITSKLWWDNANKRFDFNFCICSKNRPISLISFVTDAPDGNVQELKKICENVGEKRSHLQLGDALDLERDSEDQTPLALACR